MAHARVAAACPEGAPTEEVAARAAPTEPGCQGAVAARLDHTEHAIELGYGAAVTTTAQAGTGTIVDASTGLDLGYEATFGEGRRRAYAIAARGGVRVHRIAGAVTANGVATHAEVKLGPAALDDGDTTPRFNMVSFPFAFAIEHDGDLARLPGLSDRPVVARAAYGREHARLSTQAIQIEAGGDSVPEGQTAGPGARTSGTLGIELLAFDAELDATMQDGLLLEVGLGGALGRFRSRDPGLPAVELLGFEHREIRLPGGDATSLETVWMLRADYANPRTDTRYFIGWGALVGLAEDSALYRLFATKGDEPNTSEVQVGGVGWYWDKWWGSIGAQYRRQPFLTVDAKPAIEDRGFVELAFPWRTRVAGRGFVARTVRAIDDATLQTDVTAGVEADVARTIAGFDVAVHGELGRSYYAALDAGAPTVGFTASASLSIRRAAAVRWTR